MTNTHTTQAAATERTVSYFIVWNNGRSEGFVTDQYDDAFQVSTGMFSNPCSSLGRAFWEAYGEDEDDILKIEEIALPSAEVNHD